MTRLTELLNQVENTPEAPQKEEQLGIITPEAEKLIQDNMRNVDYSAMAKDVETYGESAVSEIAAKNVIQEGETLQPVENGSYVVSRKVLAELGQGSWDKGFQKLESMLGGN